MADLTASRQSADAVPLTAQREMKNKCGVFAADTYVERGAFMIQNVSIKMHRSSCCNDAGKSPPLSVYA
jgi:hypothetical protein